LNNSNSTNVKPRQYSTMLVALVIHNCAIRYSCFALGLPWFRFADSNWAYQNSLQICHCWQWSCC